MAQKIKGITIELNGDTSGLKKSLDGVNTDLKSLQTELNKTERVISSSMRAGIEPAEMMSQKTELLGNAIKKTEEKLQALKSVEGQMKRAAAADYSWQKQYEPLGKALDEAIKKLQKLKNKKDQMDKDLSEGKISAEQYSAYEKEVEAATNSVEALKNQIKELEKTFADGHISGEQYREYQRDVANTEARLKSYQNQLSQLNGAQATAAVSAKSFSEAVKDVKTAAGKVKSDLAEIASIAEKVGTAIAAASAGAVTYSVNVGSSFEAAMSKVQAYSLASGEEMEQLTAIAEEMGASTSKSATESAEALGYMSLAGWDTEEMMQGLEPILRASEAAEADLALTSDLVTDSMSAMGISTDDLVHYLDVCTAAQSNSNTSLTQLLEAYKAVGGTMKGLNVSVEESASLLGVLANRGKKGAEAGNNLNSLLVNLIGASSKANTAMDTLGVSAWNIDGSFKGITETLKTLGTALGNCTEEQRTLFEAQIGGKTQLDTLQALISGVTEEYDDLYATLSDSEGTLQATAKTMQDNLKGAVTAMKSALEGLGISFYKYLDEPLTEAVVSVTEQITNLRNSLSSEELAGALEKLGAALGALIERLGEFAVNDGIPALINALSWIAENIDVIIIGAKALGAAWAGWKITSLVSDTVGLVTALKNLSASTATATTEQLALNTAMKANAIGLIITAAATAATALAGYIDKQAEAIRQESAYKNAIEESYLATSDQIHALGEMNDTAADNSEKLETLITNLKDWTDANGKVTASGKDVAGAIEQINQMTGSQLELVNGQIQGYSDLNLVLDDYLSRLQKQAKIEYYSEGYNEAIAKIDQAKADELEALQAYQNNERAINELRKQPLDDAVKIQIAELESKRGDLLAAYNIAQVNVNNLERTIDEQEARIEELFNETGEKADETVYPYAGSSIAAEEENKVKVHEAELEAERIAREEALKAEKEDLDKRLALHKISEEEYYAELEKYLNEHVDKESVLWWELTDKVTRWKDDQVKAEEKANDEILTSTEETNKKIAASEKVKTEEELSDNDKALKARKEALDKQLKLHEISEEEYYAELEKYLNAHVDKSSELWWELYENVSDYRQAQEDKEIEEEKKVQKEKLDIIQAALDKVYGKYDELYKKLDSQKEAAARKLASIGGAVFSLTTDEKGNKIFEIADMQKQIDQMKDFADDIKKLRANGASDEIIAELMSMSDEEASGFADYLANMSDTEFKQINDLYTEKQKVAQDLANDIYAADYTALGESMQAEVNDVFTKYSDTVKELGVDTMMGFVAGMKEGSKEAVTAMNAFAETMLSSMRDALGIHSPSKETEEIGEYAAAGFEKGMSEAASAADDFTDEFTAILKERDDDFYNSLHNALTGNLEKVSAEMQAVLSGMRLPELNAVIPDMSKLSVPVSVKSTGTAENHVQQDSKQFDRIAGLLSVLSAKLDIMISAVNRLASRPIEITVHNTLTLDGKVIAKSTSKYQKQTGIQEGG